MIQPINVAEGKFSGYILLRYSVSSLINIIYVSNINSLCVISVPGL